MVRSASNLPLPVQRALRNLGHDINVGRRRRRIPMLLMAERTGLSRSTLAKIEKGDPTVSLAGYASVLFVLGLADRLGSVADISSDFVGQRLDEENLRKRIRSSNRARSS